MCFPGESVKTASAVVVASSPLRCPWCHADVERRERVVCAACLASHHAECWETEGRCASCGEGERLGSIAPGLPVTPARPVTRASSGPSLKEPAAPRPVLRRLGVKRVLPVAASLGLALALALAVSTGAAHLDLSSVGSLSRAEFAVDAISQAEFEFLRQTTAAGAPRFATYAELSREHLIRGPWGEPFELPTDYHFIVVVEKEPRPRFKTIGVPIRPGAMAWTIYADEVGMPCNDRGRSQPGAPVFDFALDNGYGLPDGYWCCKGK